jgi:uncharacterized protein YidB (DUF937 family)
LGQLAVGAVDFAPLMVQRHDLSHLVVDQPVHQTAPRAAIGRLAEVAALDPALSELELPTRCPQAPTGMGGLVEELEQGGLGGLVDSARDSATQPQAPFPSTSMS